MRIPRTPAHHASPRSPSLLTLGLLLGSLFLGGCKEDDSVNDFASRLRSCDLISEGDVNTGQGPVPAELRCNLRCASSESCDGLERFWCDGEATASYESCALDCISQHGFDCGDGTHVSTLWQCDGDRDCADGSDEDEEACASSGFFCESDGERIPEAFECDGEEDCSDGSDEDGCGRDTLFVCDDGEQVPAYYQCDFEEDCSDGSDEDGCAREFCD